MIDRKQIPGEEPVVRRVTPTEMQTPAPRQKPGSDRPKPQRKKVTAEDVEAAFIQRRTRRAERRGNRKPREMSTLVRAVTASVLGLGLVSCALAMNSAAAQHTVAVAANQNKVAALSGALEALAPAGEEDADTAGDLAADLAGAQQRSNELAAAQQQFAVILHAGNAETSANDGTPGTMVLQSLEQRRVLAGFFAPTSLVLTDEQAYTFRTENLLEPGRIDPRQPWYTRYDGRQASSPEQYSWQTASVSLSGTPGVMDVVWTNTDARTGDLLAWATARYSAETGTFNTLRVNTTTQGDSHRLRADDTETAPSGEESA